MNYYRQLAYILGVRPDVLEALDSVMSEKTKRTGVMEKVANENDERAQKALVALGVAGSNAKTIRQALRVAVFEHEQQLYSFLEGVPGKNEFEKSAHFAHDITRDGKGFFLKKEKGKEILRKRQPKNLLKFLEISSVEELFARHDVTEAFSALRFMETNAWMHETFDAAYSEFTPDDFEEREIEIRALGPEWSDVSKKFVEKKRHNVSHLKEFGVIFLNPVAKTVPGKFLRDTALLFHYVHEILFYSKLFERRKESRHFAERLKSLLRGDVLERSSVEDGEWLIVQRYLVKENPEDPRLFLPRVNPESMHWGRGERNLVRFGKERNDINLELWENLDWVACMADGEVISFDMEDNAMSAAFFGEDREQYLNYHQREAMWTKMFSEYVGGEEKMERLLLEHFMDGRITF